MSNRTEAYDNFAAELLKVGFTNDEVVLDKWTETCSSTPEFIKDNGEWGFMISFQYGDRVVLSFAPSPHIADHRSFNLKGSYQVRRVRFYENDPMGFAKFARYVVQTEKQLARGYFRSAGIRHAWQNIQESIECIKRFNITLSFLELELDIVPEAIAISRISNQELDVKVFGNTIGILLDVETNRIVQITLQYFPRFKTDEDVDYSPYINNISEVHELGFKLQSLRCRAYLLSGKGEIAASIKGNNIHAIETGSVVNKLKKIGLVKKAMASYLLELGNG